MSAAPRRPLPHPPLLLITDRRQAPRPLEEVVTEALGAGCRWLLLREKDLAPDVRHELALALRDLTRNHGALLCLSDDLELAAEIGADGVHLSRRGDPAQARERLGSSALIGRSAHDAQEAGEAFRNGTDYVTISPIFPSASKPGYGPPLGPAGLQRLAAALPGPVLALGGVTASTAGACLTAGAAGLAVMGEVMRAADPGAEVAALCSTFSTRS